MKAVLDGGKYAVEFTDTGHLKATRYGAEWRDLTGDNLVFNMLRRIDELEKQVWKFLPKRAVVTLSLEEENTLINDGAEFLGPFTTDESGYVRKIFLPNPKE